jgi:glycosyltransferase involved in cell wall biosynthesis
MVTHQGETYCTEKIDFHILTATQGYTIAENRNYCVVQAQKNGSDYLFFVDDDMTFPPDTLERLLNRGKEVIGVNSYSRCLPPSSTVGLMDKKGEYMHPDKHTEWEMQVPDYLFEAYFVGTGIALIDMKVFKKIKKPYFNFTYDKNGQVIHGEDGNFCKKVKDAGIGIWCDGSIEIGHLGEYEYKRPTGEFSTFVYSGVPDNFISNK